MGRIGALMTTVRELHHKAMVIAQDAKLARDAGRQNEARRLAAEAFELEVQAVALVPREAESEPTRSILCLSAGSLAMLAGEYLQAERVLTEGLSGFPPEKTRADIYEVLDQVLSERRQEQVSVEQRSTRLSLRLRGEAIGHGWAPSREVTSRIAAAEAILDRKSRMDQAQPWQNAGRAPRELQSFDTYVHAFQPGSLEIELELAPKLYSQRSFEGFAPSANEIVASVIDGLRSMQNDDFQGLAQTYPDDAYLKHFVSQARLLAPDGEAVSAVEVEGANHSLEFTRRRSSISVPRTGNLLSVAEHNASPVTARGKLVVGDISSKGKNRDTVRLEYSDGTYDIFKVTQGLEDLVKSYFGEIVVVDLEHLRRGRSVVTDVRPAPELAASEIAQ